MGFSDLFKASLDTLHSSAAYGEPATYRPASGGSYEVQGVFTAPYELVDPQESEVQSTRPILSVRDQETESLGFEVRQGDRVDLRGTEYLVADVLPDGEGATRLHLHEVTA